MTLPSSTPSRELSSEEVKAFDSDGAVRLREVIPPEWIDGIERAVDHILANPTALAGATAVLGGGGFSGDAFMWKAHPFFHSFMYDSPAATLAMQVLGSKSVKAFYDQIFAKPPRSSAPTPWHEDMSSWPVSGDQVCALWIALDPCTPTTAGLRVVRGSHRWTKKFMPVTPGTAHLDADGYESVNDLSNHEILEWDLERGDVVLFHPRAVHGASGTGPLHGRRAFVSRWVGDDVRFRPQHAVLPLLWEHGLRDGDPIGGPLFPQVLPASGSRNDFVREAPDPELTDQLLAALRFL